MTGSTATSLYPYQWRIGGDGAATGTGCRIFQLLEGRTAASKNSMRLTDYYNDMNEEQRAGSAKQAMIPGQGYLLRLSISRSFITRRKIFWPRKSSTVGIGDLPYMSSGNRNRRKKKKPAV